MLAVGDRVLVRVVAFERKHKIADKWERDVYKVLEQSNAEIPVSSPKERTGRVQRGHYIGTTCGQHIVCRAPAPTGRLVNSRPNLKLQRDEPRPAGECQSDLSDSSGEESVYAARDSRNTRPDVTRVL